MRVSIFGAGAVGGLVAARLIRAGIDVSVAARGASLERIRDRGLVVRDRDGEWTARPRAVGPAGSLGPHELVIVATKAHALPGAAADIARLVSPGAMVVSAVNGIPWWYFHGIAGWKHSPHLDSVDPEGVFWNAVGPEKAIGCVVHLGASTTAPGEVRHAYGAQFALGEPAPGALNRVTQVAELFAAAGFKPRVAPDIRVEVWKKLWSNLAINPVSLVTGAACDAISAQPDAVHLMERMMEESAVIARALGIDEPLDARKQAQGFAAIGAFKTSMLQDLEARRPVELDPILGSLVELAGLLSLDVPNLRHVYALARLRAASAGCYAPIATPQQETPA